MPKLPGPEAIPRAQPVDAYRAQSYTGGLAEAGLVRAAGIEAEGAGKFANEADKFADDYLQGQQQINYATAVQGFIQKKTQIDAAASTDRDYTTLPGRYQQQLDQAVQEAAQGVGGAKSQAQFRASMGLHVATGIQQVQLRSVAMAKDADRGWLTDFIDGGLKTALSSPDEGNRETSFRSLDSAIAGMAAKGSITEAEAAKLRKSVPERYGSERAGMLMNNDPQAAFDALRPQGTTEAGEPVFTKTGDWRDFIEPSKRMAFVHQAQTRAAENARADEIEQMRQQRIAEQARAQAAEKTSNAFVQQLITDPTKADPKTLVNDPNLKAHEKWGLYQMMNSQLAGVGHDEKTYGPGFYGAYQAIHAPDGDPNRITDPAALYARVGQHKDPATGEMVDGDLTVAGVDKLTNEIVGRRTPEGEAEATMKKAMLAGAQREISGTNDLLHLRDPKGDQLFLKFLADALPAYDKGRKDGKTSVQLLNPDSPDYVGKAIKNYKRPQNEWLKDMLESNAPGGGTSDLDLTSQDGIIAAYRANKITRDDASAALIKGGFATAPVAPAVTAPVPTAPVR